MADHLDAFDTETLLSDVSPLDLSELPQHSPGMDPRVDITDIYAFQKPGDPNKSILIMNVNPAAGLLAGFNAFRHDATYRLNINVDGHPVASRAFDVTFSAVDAAGAQTATVQLVTFADDGTGIVSSITIIQNAPVSFTSTADVTEGDPYKFFAGKRSDPFFFDLLGFLEGLMFTTGNDFFIGLNVFGIVLQVPNTALGSNPQIGVWAQTLAGGSIIDQMGRPAINTVFNKGIDKNTFNQTPPDQQRDLFLDKFVAVLAALDPARSHKDNVMLAKVLLPDILTYNFSNSAGFLNGRQLADDVIDAELRLLTGNPAASDGVGKHSDYLSDFPYLGPPH